MSAAKPAGSMVYGITSIARYVGLSIDEAARRIERNQIPVSHAGTLPIASKVDLDRLKASPWFNRRCATTP
jgi:hypothetical protein